MKKKLISLALVLAFILLCLGGCSSNSKDKYTVYYLDINKSVLVPKEYEVQSTKVDDVIEELLGVLSNDTDSPKYFQPIPSDVKVKECKLNEGNLIIDFSGDYYSIKDTKEVLTRAAITKTMLQIEGVNKVTFYVSNKQLVDENGNVVSSMTNDSFIDNYGDESSFLVKKGLSLYYATEDGESLICEKKFVDVDERKFIADVVLDNIRKKPDVDNAKVAVPEDTKVLYTAISDGVCYVTLDSTLLTEKSDISNKAIIYSIVNSLCDSADVKTVVIKISNTNAKTQQNNLEISGTYVADKSMVVEVVSSKEMV
ncbi:MAG TPA: hypothetical protein DCR12_02670 [Lachnospiraceae bacterium]|nr:hypothetical protein [Lachnospiraceae bacterium]